MQGKVLLLIGNFDCSEEMLPTLTGLGGVSYSHALSPQSPAANLEGFALVLITHNLQQEYDKTLIIDIFKKLGDTPLVLVSEQARPSLIVELFNDGFISQHLSWPIESSRLLSCLEQLVVSVHDKYNLQFFVPNNTTETVTAEKLPLGQVKSLKKLSLTKLKEENNQLEKYRRIVENLQDEYIFYSKDANNQITYISPSVYNILGFTQDEWQPQFFKHFTRSTINKKAYEFSQQTLAGKQTPAFEIEILDKHGHTRYFEISEIPVFDSINRLVAIEGIAHDITRQQKTLLKARRNLILQTTLSEISSAFSQTDRFEEIIEDMLAKIGDQVELAAICLVELNTHSKANVLAAWHQKNIIVNTSHELVASQLHQLKEQGFLQLPQNHIPEHDKQQATSLFFPLTYQNGLQGYLYLSIPEGINTSQEENEFIHTSANMIAQAYKHSKAHEELLGRVNQFTRLFEQAPFGIIAFESLDQKVIINDAFLNIVGYSRKDLANQTAASLLLKLSYDTDKTSMLILFDEISSKKLKSYSSKQQFIHKDGQEVWVNISGAFLKKEIDEVQMNIIMVQDITEKIKVEKEKTAEKEKLDQILNSLPISISLKNEEGRYLFFNELGCSYTGKYLDDILGKKAREIFPPRLASIYESQDIQARKHRGEVIWFEIKKQTAEGAKDMLVGKKVIPSLDKEKLLLSFEVDVTTLKKVELDLQKALNQLDKVQTNLEQSEKMSSLGILTAGVAHEINNPVNFIQGGVYILEDYLEPLILLLKQYGKFDQILSPEETLSLREEIKEMKEVMEFDDAINFLNDGVESIRKGAERTIEIIRVLRNFSRADESLSSGIDLHEGLDSTLMLLQNKLKNRIEVFKDYAAYFPSIECNSGQINQVFMNILSNAEQAIQEEGEIRIKTSFDQKQVVIRITDSGSGMSEETKQRIFEPFYTTKKIGVGTGLGLSISHSIIEKHGGRIEVSSEIGIGTVFTIILPITQSS